MLKPAGVRSKTWPPNKASGLYFSQSICRKNASILRYLELVLLFQIDARKRYGRLGRNTVIAILWNVDRSNRWSGLVFGSSLDIDGGFRCRDGRFERFDGLKLTDGK